MSIQLQETLETQGHANVIVSLYKNQLTPDESAHMEQALGEYFTASSVPQSDSIAAGLSDPAPKMLIYPNLGLALGVTDTKGAKKLANNNAVAGVNEAPVISLIRPVGSRRGRPTIGPSWGIRQLGVVKMWDAGITGDGVMVGHLDTGVDGNHPALSGAIGDFAEFNDAGEIIPSVTAWDSESHGTHTAGTIVGQSVDGRTSIGVAPGATLASGMVIEGGNVVARILAGMEWIASKRLRILNMSLGLRGYTPAFQAVVDALRRLDILPVIAVGNEGPNSSRSPGNYSNVLSIGASTRTMHVAGFSSSNTFNNRAGNIAPDLVAPGDGILSCVPGTGYKRDRGTSMATPHIAGLAALLLQADPTASANDLEDVIKRSCVVPSTMHQQRANLGLPSAEEAYFLLTGTRL